MLPLDRNRLAVSSLYSKLSEPLGIQTWSLSKKANKEFPRFPLGIRASNLPRPFCYKHCKNKAFVEEVLTHNFTILAMLSENLAVLLVILEF